MPHIKTEHNYSEALQINISDCAIFALLLVIVLQLVEMELQYNSGCH